MYRICSETHRRIRNALGFEFDLVGVTRFEAHGDYRTCYTVKRPNGAKNYQVIQHGNGAVVAV